MCVNTCACDTTATRPASNSRGSSEVMKTTRYVRAHQEAWAKNTAPAHKAAHLAAREAAWSQSGHSVLCVCLRNAAEVLLGEVQQLPVLHPCQNRQHCYWPGRVQGTGSGDPTSYLSGRQKENMTSGQGEGRVPCRQTLPQEVGQAPDGQRVPMTSSPGKQ